MEEATLTTRFFGLHYALRLIVLFLRVVHFMMLSLKDGKASTTSSICSTLALQQFKDLDGAGSFTTSGRRLSLIALQQTKTQSQMSAHTPFPSLALMSGSTPTI